MRLVVALVSVLALTACQQPADKAADKAAEDGAQTEMAEAEVNAPIMPADAPPQEEPLPGELAPTSETTCLNEVGPAASARLVQRCIAVSPATRPPCNAANPCALIQGEIDRACGMSISGEDKPAECSA